MRLEEISSDEAAKRRINGLEANASLAKQKADQLKHQVNALTSQLRGKRTQSSGTSTIKPKGPKA